MQFILACSILSLWVEEEGVLEFILDRQTTHIELIKRLGHVDPLWALTLGGQHESTRYIVYELISELTESINLEQTAAIQVDGDREQM